MKSKTAIFCTHSQYHQDFYTERIVSWASDLSFCDDVDLYTIVDGELSTVNLEKLKQAGVYVVEIKPWLGRVTLRDFRGWKRSFGIGLTLMSAKYEYVTHLEGDAVILNKEKFSEYLNKPGMYSGWLDKQHFMESSLQIMNDRQTRDKLAYKYVRKAGYEDNLCVERVIRDMNIYEYPFTVRRVGGNLAVTGYDVLTDARGRMHNSKTLKPKP